MQKGTEGVRLGERPVDQGGRRKAHAQAPHERRVLQRGKQREPTLPVRKLERLEVGQGLAVGGVAETHDEQVEGHALTQLRKQLRARSGADAHGVRLQEQLSPLAHGASPLQDQDRLDLCILIYFHQKEIYETTYKAHVYGVETSHRTARLARHERQAPYRSPDGTRRPRLWAGRNSQEGKSTCETI
jgi:hypothetical protein